MGNWPRTPAIYWVDLPLRAGDKIIGKLTLDCITPERAVDHLNVRHPDAKHPRDFEFLRVFCELIDVLLQAWVIWDNQFEEKLETRRKISESLAHEALHDVKTRLVPLGFCLTDNRKLEQRFDPLRLKKSNDRLERIIDDFESCYNTITLRFLDDVLRFEPVDLGELFLGLEVAAVVRVEVAIPTEPITLDADRPRLLRALRELVQNAHDYSGRLAQDLRVTITAAPFDRAGVPWVRMVVADNGAGVPDADKSRIFEKYISLQPREGPHGWGLAFVQRIVQGHGGTVREDGTPGKGAQFVIELPRFQQPRQ